MPRIAVAVLLIVATTADARTWHITPDGLGDAPTIQAAVNLATPGDVIRLSAGTFTGPGNSDLIIHEKDLELSGEGVGSTVIDAAGSGPSLILVESSSLVAGIAFLNGHSGFAGGAILIHDSTPRITACLFENNRAVGGNNSGGGAIYLEDAPGRVEIEDCVFRRNSVDGFGAGGGAIFAMRSSLRLIDCVFEGNSSATFGSGAAVYARNSPLEATECRFLANEANGAAVVTSGDAAVAHCFFEDNPGGGLAAGTGLLTIADCSFIGNRAWNGGGLMVHRNATVTRCVFRNNITSGQGGGVRTGTNSVVSFVGCEFVDNVAGAGAGVSTGREATFRDCTFRGNEARDATENAAPSGGGALIASDIGSGPVTFLNCTFDGNTGSMGAHLAARGAHAVVQVSRSILSFGNGPAVSCLRGGAVQLECSDVFGNSGGNWIGCVSGQGSLNGNFSADPQYCDLRDGDLTLRSTSPCAPGATGCNRVGALLVSCEPTRIAPLTWGRIKETYR